MSLDLQDKEEVQEYLQNIGIEYRFQCYSEKRPDGCHRLGDFLEAVRQEYAKAAVVYQHNCDTNNHAHSCFKAGNYRLLGRGFDQDGEIAFQYHKKACDLGFPVACYQAGLLKWEGKCGASADQDTALKLFEKGCDANDSESCYRLGTTYLGKVNDATATPEDEKRAFQFTERACRLNHMYACANLYQLYKRGMGCEKDDVLADAVKKKAVAIRDAYSRSDPGIVFGE